MLYEIKAPVETYNRRLYNVQFKDGVGKTEDEAAARWFAGRQGFTVKPIKSGKAVESAANEQDDTKEKKAKKADK